MRIPFPVFASLAFAAAAAAQPAPYPHRNLPYDLDSAFVDNASAQVRTIAVGSVRVPGATSLHLYFDRTNLPEGSRLRLTSAADGAVQFFDALSLADYRNSSAWFNGEEVAVELLAGPGTVANRVKVVGVDAGEGPAVQIQSQCGPTDDRVASNDRRAGRQHTTGCTTWLIDKHTVITAGHCSSATQQVHFNVPLSQSNGTIVLPPPEHQYMYDGPTLRRLNAGIGQDWTVCSTLRNSNTGLYAGQAQGASFRLVTTPAFQAGDTIRITGYGTDSGSANQTQQTHVGPRVNVTTANSVGYQTDTTGGNSGSPVILERTGEAIGVHTHGGCTTSGTGNNWGTANNRADWAAALAEIPPMKRPGCYELFGNGCAGTAGTPALANAGFPDLGRTMQLVVTSARANTTVAFFFGASNTNYNGLQLPFPLGNFQMPGCSLLVSVDFVLSGGTNASGEARLSFGMPNVAGLIGTKFHNQVAVVDQGANGAGVVMTNGGTATVGM
jgi:hypothetical protein